MASKTGTLAGSCFNNTNNSATSAVLLSPDGNELGACLKDSSEGSIVMSKSDDAHTLVLKRMKSSDGEADVNIPFASKFPGINVNFERFPQPDFKFEDMEKEFVCGWGAAFINITATFPINKAIFRQQLQGIGGYKAVRQLKNEGLRNLYRGLLPPLMQKTTTLSIMFGSYRKFQQYLDNSFPKVPIQVNHATAAMMAGTLEMTLCPFERIQTLLQDRTYHQRFNNTFHATKELWAFGIREYYRGGMLIFLRNGPSNVFFFLGREFLNDHLPQLENSTSRLAKDFICGACLGALISTGFFPLNVVKTRMQSRVGGPFYGVWYTFQEVWVERNRKVSGLFRGFHLNYTRSFISWGIINASYEYLMQLFRELRTDGRL